MLSKERTELLLQTLTKGIAVGGEVDVGGSVLRDLKQAVLDAESGVLQAEVERSSSASHSYPRLVRPFATVTASHRASHDFPTFGVPARMCNPLREQCVHHEIQRCERLTHQRFTVDGQQSVFFFQFRILLKNIAPHRNDESEKKAAGVTTGRRVVSFPLLVLWWKRWYPDKKHGQIKNSCRTDFTRRGTHGGEHHILYLRQHLGTERAAVHRRYADRRSAEFVAGRIPTHEQTHEAGHQPCGRI